MLQKSTFIKGELSHSKRRPTNGREVIDKLVCVPEKELAAVVR
jgi:hypothetical protein